MLPFNKVYSTGLYWSGLYKMVGFRFIDLAFSFSLFFLLLVAQEDFEFHGARFNIRFGPAPRCTLYIKEKTGETGQWYAFEPIYLAEFAEGPSGGKDYLSKYNFHPFQDFADGQNWTITTSSLYDPIFNGRVDNLNFTTILPNGASVSFCCYYFEAGGEMFFEAGPYLHSFPPDTYKFGAIISNWPFQNTSNNAEIYIVFKSSDPITLPVYNEIIGDIWVSQPTAYRPPSPSEALSEEHQDPCSFEYKNRTRPKRGLDMKFLSFAEVDGQRRDLDWEPTLPGLLDGSESFPYNILTIGHFFRFDYFNSSVVYDPDMTVLLTGDDDDEPEECDGDGDGLTSTELGVTIGVTLGAALILSLLVLIAGLVFLQRKKLKKRTQLDKMSVDMRELSQSETGDSRAM